MNEIDLDWDASEPHPDGKALVEVAGVAIKNSKTSGDRYVSLDLRVKSGPNEGRSVFDICMMEGPGMAMGYAKIQAFGVKKGQKKFDPMFLIGERAYASLTVQEDQNGNPQLKVDAKDKTTRCGYHREAPDDPPPADAKPLEDVPF